MKKKLCILFLFILCLFFYVKSELTGSESSLNNEKKAYSSDGKIMVLGPDVFSAVQAVREAEDLRNNLVELLDVNRDAGLPIKIRISWANPQNLWGLSFVHKNIVWESTSSGTSFDNRSALAQGILALALLNIEADKQLVNRSIPEQFPEGVFMGLTILISEGPSSFIKDRSETISSIIGKKRILEMFDKDLPKETASKRKYFLRCAETIDIVLSKTNGKELFVTFLEKLLNGQLPGLAYGETFGFPETTESSANSELSKNKIVVSPESFFFTAEQTGNKIIEIVGSFRGEGPVSANSFWSLYDLRKQKDSVPVLTKKKIALINLRLRADPEFQNIINNYLNAIDMGLNRSWTKFQRLTQKAELALKKRLGKSEKNNSFNKR
ncbi:MAG: hypothetical protein P9M03_04710 [Candidatus Theseobacter exili]|nr:hypothetical protein [Candidatus Theseobacter exili]